MIYLVKGPMNVMRSELEGGRRSKNRTNGKNKKSLRNTVISQAFLF